MAEEQRAEQGLVRLATGLFRHIEHFVYIVLGTLLSAAALLALGGAAIELWHALGNWTRSEAIFSIIDPLLFVLLLIEILHTIRASIRTGNLTPEPFLIVGLIASIRRILVITLQTSEVTKPGTWNPQNQEILPGVDDRAGRARRAGHDPGDLALPATAEQPDSTARPPTRTPDARSFQAGVARLFSLTTHRDPMADITA